ncbi:MAG: hypothetical protein HY689_04510 [Chloroflexi bacterium]|nr:hypothetical protein [Chloroflexota bacterium]
MQTDDLEGKWRALTTELTRSMKQWRMAHPRATLREIETALDERLTTVRAQMLQDSASTSPLMDVQAAQAAGVAVTCPGCGQALEDRGKQRRQLTTQGEQALTLAGCGKTPWDGHN